MDVPDRLTVGGDRPGHFERRRELVAVAGAADDGGEALAVVQDAGGERFAVYDRATRGAAERPAGIPVYAAPGGQLAVPTGRVFVRLAAGAEARAHEGAFGEAGFRIDRLLSYAPNAAWLRPAAGGAVEALQRLDALAKVPGVVHVEPQLLMERALKG